MLFRSDICRRGEGPVLVEAKTYRWLGHSKSDANVYRTKEEIQSWKEKDPIKALRDYMIKNEISTDEQLDNIEIEARQTIEAAVEFAQNSPDPGLETLLEDVYAD